MALSALDFRSLAPIFGHLDRLRHIDADADAREVHLRS